MMMVAPPNHTKRSPQRSQQRRLSHLSGVFASSSTGGGGGSSTNSKWEVLLEQGYDLAVRRGSVDAVTAAVQRGADLRLYLTTDTYGTFYEEVMNFRQSLCRDDAHFSGMGPFLSSVHHGQDIQQPNAAFFNYDTCRGMMEGPTHSLMKLIPGQGALDESGKPSNHPDFKPANYHIYRCV
jgi:hypothetical protein